MKTNPYEIAREGDDIVIEHPCGRIARWPASSLADPSVLRLIVNSAYFTGAQMGMDKASAIVFGEKGGGKS